MQYDNKISGFEWDTGNREKCRKHGVSLAEVEELFAVEPMVFADPSVAEARMRAVGQISSGRYVFVAFTLRRAAGRLLLRPISARYMHRKEILNYEQAAATDAPKR